MDHSYSIGKGGLWANSNFAKDKESEEQTCDKGLSCAMLEN